MSYSFYFRSASERAAVYKRGLKDVRDPTPACAAHLTLAESDRYHVSSLPFLPGNTLKDLRVPFPLFPARRFFKTIFGWPGANSDKMALDDSGLVLRQTELSLPLVSIILVVVPFLGSQKESLCLTFIRLSGEASP